MKSHLMKAVFYACLLVLLLIGCGGEETAQEGGTKKKEIFDHSYSSYAGVLERCVGVDGGVDFEALRADTAALDSAIAAMNQVSSYDFGRFTDGAMLAFWINAYNALTLQAVRDAYPIKSIKDIDGVWDKKRYDIAGRTVTLDDIRHTVFRRRFTDPRIHFTVYTASVSCPPLWRHPYTHETIDNQIAEATTRFLMDTHLNRFDRPSKSVKLSQLFEWYGGDFEKLYASRVPSDQDQMVRAVLNMIAAHVPDSIGGFLLDEGITVEYLKYDWGLVDQSKTRR